MTEKSKRNKQKPDPALLLHWYDRNRRSMPWRALSGQKANPYHVWLSEIMLQQTTVAAVGPYFLKFVKRWPSLQKLAKASLEEVMQAWAGLGYYRRAKGLHACAQRLVDEYGGQFPETEDELRNLPGIGPYTSAAIAAIAFDHRANVVDGNVERVMARIFAVKEPLPAAKVKLKALAASCLPESRFGDYAQALMDLGATVCAPRSPKCSLCPWQEACCAYQTGKPEAYPARLKAKTKQQRTGTAFALFDKQGRIFLQQRNDEGLLAGMMEVPSTPWQEGKALAWSEALAYVPLRGRSLVRGWSLLEGAVHHTFTHFDLDLSVAIARIRSPGLLKGGKWVCEGDLDQEALPSLMKKVIRKAQSGVTHENKGR